MATKTKKAATKKAATKKRETKKGKTTKAATRKAVTGARRTAGRATKAARSPRESAATDRTPIVGRGRTALMIGGVEYRFDTVEELREMLEALRGSLAELHTAVTAALSMIDGPADARLVIDEEIDVIVPSPRD
ncbi:MAG TPA: hypothetical protein VET86_09340 [Casimicrobiaceae bacterium]|jgi:hypothetical protein|nr:hypothetical protein [Casimicrobiaceae bacterium]